MRVSRSKNGDKKRASFAQVSALSEAQKSKGYDRLQYWTRMELRRLYQAEGYSTKEASRMAGDLYKAVRNLNRRELYSWNKARELERLYGPNAVDLLGGKCGKDAEEIWHIIENMRRPEVGGLTHYERHRGQRMRLEPEVKKARAEGRAEERRREREELREERFLQLVRRYEELKSQLELVRVGTHGDTASQP